MSQSRRILTKQVIAAVGSLLWLGPLAPDLTADSTVDEQVRTIRSRYDEIERSLGRCQQVRREVFDESTEGGVLLGYFAGKSLRKLTAKFYGEGGRALEEYYFWDDRLFFVLRVESRYDKPLSGKVKSKSEERFYFADNALIRWLDPRKKEVSAGPELQRRGQDLLAQAKKYTALVRNAE